MDNTQDWMDDLNGILDQHTANERRLQGLPAEDKPKDSEDEPMVPEEPEESESEPKVSEDEPIVSVQMADVSTAPEVKELDEDEKEELRQENRNLVEAFVVSGRRIYKLSRGHNRAIYTRQNKSRLT